MAVGEFVEVKLLLSLQGSFGMGGSVGWFLNLASIKNGTDKKFIKENHTKSIMDYELIFLKNI